MNAEVKKLWVEALRSGDYLQGRLSLRNEKNEYCCMGVLCDIYLQEHPKVPGSPETNWEYKDEIDKYQIDGEGNYLPEEVMKWAGLESKDPQCRETHLSYMNDMRKYTFKQIADQIEIGL